MDGQRIPCPTICWPQIYYAENSENTRAQGDWNKKKISMRRWIWGDNWTGTDGPVKEKLPSFLFETTIKPGPRCVWPDLRSTDDDYD